jgi:hypothetical protein
VSCRCTDQRGTPNSHVSNRFSGRSHIGDGSNLESVGQQGLVDNSKSARYVVEPNRSVVLAGDPHEGSIALERAERADFAAKILEKLHTAKVGKRNDERTLDHFGPHFSKQLDRGRGCSSSRKKVIYQKNLLTA